jgi:GT2 family glycosyltransferase
MPAICVIIVNYNGAAFLQGALDSLRAQTFRDFEVLVVDNNSTDGSADGLKSDGLPAFELLRQSDNLGFARGNNFAAQRTEAKWLALLNPDAVAHPDWLEEISKAVVTYPGVTSFACTQLSLEDNTILDGAGDCYFGFGIPWRGAYQRPASELPGPGECFSPCGASAVYLRETFLQHGGFDERFFCYCEDVDLGYRLRLAGERCIFVPTAVVQHAGSGISGIASPFALYHGTRNRLWAYAKNTPFWLLVLTLPGHVALTAAILLRGLFTGRARDSWRGLKAGLAGLKTIRQPAPYAAPKRTATVWSLLRIMAWNPLRLLDGRAVIRPLPRGHAGETDTGRPAATDSSLA